MHPADAVPLVVRLQQPLGAAGHAAGALPRNQARRLNLPGQLAAAARRQAGCAAARAGGLRHACAAGLREAWRRQAEGRQGSATEGQRVGRWAALGTGGGLQPGRAGTSRVGALYIAPLDAPSAARREGRGCRPAPTPTPLAAVPQRLPALPSDCTHLPSRWRPLGSAPRTARTAPAALLTACRANGPGAPECGEVAKDSGAAARAGVGIAGRPPEHASAAQRRRACWASLPVASMPARGFGPLLRALGPNAGTAASGARPTHGQRRRRAGHHHRAPVALRRPMGRKCNSAGRTCLHGRNAGAARVPWQRRGALGGAPVHTWLR